MLFWAIRIFLKQGVRRHQLFMAAGMMVAVMTILAGNYIALFMYPFFLLAVRDITVPGGITKWETLLFLPSLLLIPFNQTLFARIFLLAQVVILSVWLIIEVMRYRRLMSEYFDTGSDTSDYLGQTIIYLLSTVTLIIVIILLPEHVTGIPLVTGILSLVIAVLQFLMGYSTFHLQDSPTASELEEPDVPEVTDASTETASPEGAAPAAMSEAPAPDSAPDADRRLLQRIIDERLFTDPTVSLVSLAAALNTNRTYLSNKIHACYHQNFSDFINTLRIKNAVELMAEAGTDINIKDVAMQSGYSNLQSFYRNFALIMDMTPKSWQLKNLQR